MPLRGTLEDRLVRMQQDFRKGATLTEVLIALLIMSIGLVALAVLFPISVLRSIKATQFTNATDVRYNAEAMIDLYPAMIRNPDYSLVLGAHNGENFVVDPLGYAKTAGVNATLANYFGYDEARNVPSPTPWIPASVVANSWTFRRYPYLWTLPPAATLTQQQQEQLANYLVAMPDSWLLQSQQMRFIRQTPAAGDGVTQIDIPTIGETLSTTSPAPPVRVVLFSADGLTSHARSATQITTGPQSNASGGTQSVDTIVWTEDLNGDGTLQAGEDVNGNGALDQYPLPTNFTNGGIGKVRVELQEPRYTWLLTVRMDAAGTAPHVDVVVFFKRKFDFNIDEYLFQATFTAGTNSVNVTYKLGINAATNLEYKPFMHKGNYIFDADNAFWYRISNVIDSGTGTAQIVLDVPANASSPFLNNQSVGRAMFPRNIVDVYPLGGK